MIEVELLRKEFVVRHRVGRLRRRRHVVRAVDDISFSIATGEMVGYIGPNGAGKSTTAKMLTGVLTPSAGRVEVAGLVPSRDRVALARRIGVVFGQRSLLWWDLPLGDSFELLRHLYRIDVPTHRARLDTCVDLLEMGRFLRTPVRQLSLGQRMRGELTAVLLHHPQLLVLDEPTIGLDVVSRSKVRGFLSGLNRDEGTTVLLATHDLGDIERLCRRLLVIDHGHVVFDGALDVLRERYGTTRTLVVDLAEPAPALQLAGVEVIRVEGPRQWLRFPRSHTTAAEVTAQVAAQADLVDLTVEEPAIEDIVTRIYATNP